MQNMFHDHYFSDDELGNNFTLFFG